MKEYVSGLIYSDLTPCRPYSLNTLRLMGTIDLPTAVKASGQILSTFDDPEKYKTLAERTMGREEVFAGRNIYRNPQTGRYISKANRLDGGFALAALVRYTPRESELYKLYEYTLTPQLISRLAESGITGLEPSVAYNEALNKEVFNPEDAVSLEFQKALRYWDQNLNPFRGDTLDSQTRFARAESQGSANDMVWGVRAYYREYLGGQVGEKTPANVIGERLREILSWPSYFGTTPETPHGVSIQNELKLIADNADLVVLAYERAGAFRQQHFSQIQTLSEVYGQPNRSDAAHNYASQLREFLQA